MVEVAPIYDNPGETTVLAAAQVVHSLLTLMVQKPVGWRIGEHARRQMRTEGTRGVQSGDE